MAPAMLDTLTTIREFPMQTMVAHRRGFLLKLFLVLVLIVGLLQLLKIGAESNLVPQLQQGGRELAALGDIPEAPPQPPVPTQPEEVPTELPETTTKQPTVQDRVKKVNQQCSNVSIVGKSF